MLRIARIDENRVQLRAVGRSILIAAAPRFALRMLVESVDTLPRRAAVVRAKQSLRRCARVARPRLGGMAGRQPKRVVDDTYAACCERRRFGRFFPSPTRADATK